MMPNKKTGLLFALCLVALSASAQEVEMADQFRASGKIYVVVAVLATIMLGLSIFLFRMDRRISRLEKEKKKL